jgi:hypothetical protein
MVGVGDMASINKGICKKKKKLLGGSCIEANPHTYTLLEHGCALVGPKLVLVKFRVSPE